MIRFFSPLSSLAPITGAILAFVLLILSGCDSLEPLGRPRFVIVLVDETESFALYENGKISRMFWPEVIPCVAEIVDRLNPGERFCVIGIDEHGFDTDDVRIPITTIDENPLKSVRQKRDIKKAVGEITRRQEKHRRTDVLGALDHAAHFLAKQNSHRGVIAVFSDMIQEPELPTLKDVSHLKFPQETEIHCFFVNATGRDRWDRIVDAWVTVLKAAGAKITDHDFYQRAEKDQLGKVFPDY